MTSEMSRMSFGSARHSAGQSMSLDRKVVGYKTRTVSEPIYDIESIKNMTTEICNKVANINPDSICIPINVCLEGYNKYKLCAYTDSGCSVCFEKKGLYFHNSCGRKQKILYT